MPVAQAAKSNAHSSRDIFVGRQPIYEGDLSVAAYELLFRDGRANRADVDGEQATSHVVLNSFIDIGLERIVGDSRAFINLTRDFIVGNYASIFPPERVTFEIVEDSGIDDDFVRAVRALADAGYSLALDDFTYHERLVPLIELVDIVKLDVLALDREALEDTLRLLRRYDVRTVAEKVETYADFAYCRDLGFDYFQGYFFCKPDVVRGQRTPGNRQALLLLLARLQDPDTDFAELERLISQDVALTYKLLRLVNSAFYARPKRVESIREALVILGTKLIATWVSLINLTGIEDKPNELMMTAMVRARMCERLAEAMRRPAKDSYFLVGLFSVLDALLDAPMEDVVAELPLSDELRQALLTRSGPIGSTLASVLAYERAAWEDVDLPGLEPAVVAGAYLDAVEWTYRIQSVLAS